MSNQSKTYREYPTRPLPAVAAVIIDGTKVLLARRRNPPNAGAWSVPGGKQELGETVEEALRREVKEETGLKVAALRLFEAGDIIRHDERGHIRYHYTILYFIVHSYPGKPRPGDDVSDVRWAGPRERERLGLSEELQEILEQALANERWDPLHHR